MKQLATIANNPSKSQRVQAIVKIIAGLEHRQLSAVEELHDALEIEGLSVGKSREEREEQLLGLVDAFADGDLVGFWFEDVAGEHLENADRAKAYAGMSDEEWQTQIENWAANYRREGVSEDLSDREIATEHVYRTFGVSLDVFEREVIGFTPGDALETLLAANFQAVEQGINAATEEVKA